MNIRYYLSVVFVLTSLSAFAFAAQQNLAPKKEPATSSAPKPAAQTQNEGQRVFEQQCSRCHTAPEGFSPRISGTIVRHMRVRASLSQHDEKELLRFLNP